MLVKWTIEYRVAPIQILKPSFTRCIEHIIKTLYCVNCSYIAPVTLAHILQVFWQYFHHSSFTLERFLFLHHFWSHSAYLILSRYFFYVTFAIMLFTFQECSMCLFKHYWFEIYVSVIWKTLFILFNYLLGTCFRWALSVAQKT